MEGVNEEIDFPYGYDAPTTRHHRGRQRFHRLVDACIEDYVNANDRSAERSAINERLLREMRPGRFLKRRNTDGAWSYVGEEAEKTKVNKVLADEASKFRERLRRTTERTANSEQNQMDHSVADDAREQPSPVLVQPNPPSGSARPPAHDSLQADRPYSPIQALLDEFDREDAKSFLKGVDPLEVRTSHALGEQESDAQFDDERKPAAIKGGVVVKPRQLDGDGSTDGTTAPITDGSHSSSNDEQGARRMVDQQPGHATVNPPDQNPAHFPQARPIKKKTRWVDLWVLPGIHFQGCEVDHARLRTMQGGVYVELQCKCDNSCRFQSFRNRSPLSLGKIVTCQYRGCIRQNGPTLPVKEMDVVDLLRPPRLRCKGCHVDYALLDLQTGSSVELQCKCDNPDCGLPFSTPLPSQLDGVLYCESCSQSHNSASEDATIDDNGAGGNESSQQDGSSPDSNMGGRGGSRRSDRDSPSSPQRPNGRSSENHPHGRVHASVSAQLPPGLRFEGCHLEHSRISLRNDTVKLQCRCHTPSCRFPNFSSALPSEPNGVVICQWCSRQNRQQPPVYTQPIQEEQVVASVTTNSPALLKEIDISNPPILPKEISFCGESRGQPAVGESSFIGPTTKEGLVLLADVVLDNVGDSKISSCSIFDDTAEGIPEKTGGLKWKQRSSSSPSLPSDTHLQNGKGANDSRLDEDEPTIGDASASDSLSSLSTYGANETCTQTRLSKPSVKRKLSALLLGKNEGHVKMPDEPQSTVEDQHYNLTIQRPPRRSSLSQSRVNESFNQDSSSGRSISTKENETATNRANTLLHIDNDIIPTECLHENDVLGGRLGKSAYLNHAGNVRYRRLLKKNVEYFSAADSPRRQRVVAESIRSEVEGQGGKFLERKYRNESGPVSAWIIAGGDCMTCPGGVKIVRRRRFSIVSKIMGDLRDVCIRPAARYARTTSVCPCMHCSPRAAAKKTEALAEELSGATFEVIRTATENATENDNEAGDEGYGKDGQIPGKHLIRCKEVGHVNTT